MLGSHRIELAPVFWDGRCYSGLLVLILYRSQCTSYAGIKYHCSRQISNVDKLMNVSSIPLDVFGVTVLPLGIA